MNILHINYSDRTGGAAIAANRHNDAMNRAGLSSKLLVVKKDYRQNPNIVPIKKNKKKLFIYAHLLNLIHNFFIKIHKTFATFSISFWGFSISKHPLIKNADIIYLHWVNSSMISIKEIERILKIGKPVFWYMHDMNPITGGCHYSLDCNKYESACFDCPMIKKKHILDLAKYQFQQKIRRWSKYKNFNIVTPSSWLAECVKKSSIFKGHQVFQSPNVIDTNLYKPISKVYTKKLFNISENKKLILFGADNVNSPYKGWIYLKEALSLLNPEEYECLIFGEQNDAIIKSLAMKVTFTGYLHDDYSLISAYNAADVFVTPSLADNFPNVILEAMACGLPCVGFNTGGIPDLIRHKITGYLAETKNSKDLADGIKWVIDSNNSNLSETVRRTIIDNYSFEKIIEIHKELKL